MGRKRESAAERKHVRAEVKRTGKSPAEMRRDRDRERRLKAWGERFRRGEP